MEARPLSVADANPLRPFCHVADRPAFQNPHPGLPRAVEQNPVEGGTDALKSPAPPIRTVVRGARRRGPPTHAMTRHTQKSGRFHLGPHAQKIEQRQNGGRERLADLVAWEAALFEQHHPVAERSQSGGDGRAGRAAARHDDVGFAGHERTVQMPLIFIHRWTAATLRRESDGPILSAFPSRMPAVSYRKRTHSTISSAQSRSRNSCHGRIQMPSLVRRAALSLQTTIAWRGWCSSV